MEAIGSLMSNVNIKRAVENIKVGTTVYSPIIEVIVNSIDAIDSKGDKDGEIIISVGRSKQYEFDGSLPDVENIQILDNGIGFTDEHREAFDTLYTDQKLKQGGKGFGRFVCLKYFEDFLVYKDGDNYFSRTFRMGKKKDIIVNEIVKPATSTTTGSMVSLSGIKHGKFPDKKLKTIARVIIEKILPYFISEDYVCPKIILTEMDSDDSIELNDFVNNELSAVIKEIDLADNGFQLSGQNEKYNFSVRVFKFYSPRNMRSKISLVAHKREVTESSIYNFIPEFIDEFYDEFSEDENLKNRNYIIKAYVFGEYLDDNVSFERGGFNFEKTNDIMFGISQSEIEKAAAEIARHSVGDEIKSRQEKKRACVFEYVYEQAPWHRDILQNLDLSHVPYNPTEEEIEIRLQKEKYTQEISIKREINRILNEGNIDDLKANVGDMVKKISGTSKNDLVHYIALRRHVIDIFQRSLELNVDGSYSSEGIVHDIIFPRRSDSEKTTFDDHNLWIFDERLNFTQYVSSDIPLNGGTSDRADLLVYNKRVTFRGDNEPSNPVMVFEFKKPQRDDFVNPSSKEDPIQQIVRYVNKIRAGEFKTPEGREIRIADNTPFYGYVVCDLTSKVKKWLVDEKDFDPMPDNLGWYQWRKQINLYIEVLSWDKVLNDAKMRNKIFFHKLGI